MTARQPSKAPSRNARSRPARAAAIAAVAAASLVSSSAEADAASNMNLGYEFLDESAGASEADAGPTGTSIGAAGAESRHESEAGRARDSAGVAGAAGMPGTASIVTPPADGPAGESRVGPDIDSKAGLGAGLPSGETGSGPRSTSQRPDEANASRASATSAERNAASSESVPARLVLAEQLYRSGRYDEALPAFRAIVESAPGHAHAWLRLGNLMHRKRDWFDALTAYRRAARPDADPALREKAVYNIALLNLELARQALKRLQRMRIDAEGDGRGGASPSSGVDDQALRRLSDQVGATYSALSTSRRGQDQSRSADSPSATTSPAPGPRAAKPANAGRGVTEVEVRQGGVSR